MKKSIKILINFIVGLFFVGITMLIAYGGLHLVVHISESYHIAGTILRYGAITITFILLIILVFMLLLMVYFTGEDIANDIRKRIKKRKEEKMIKKLLLFSASALLLGACSIEEKDEPEIIEEETEEVEVEEAEEVEEEKEIVLGKRSNPVPFGETVRFSLRAIDDDTQEEYKGKGSLVINDMVRGEEAYNKLIDYNQFNDEAPEGYEWAILNLRFTLDELENEDVPYYVYFDIKSYGDDGSEGPRESAVVGDEFGYVELYSGGTTEGEHPILLPKGDENAKVKVSDWDNNIFMELK